MHPNSAICITCTRAAQLGGAALRIDLSQDILRAVDIADAQNPASRPPHYPPPCAACNGFVWIVYDGNWSRCGACRDHPGHACTHTEWTALRG